MELPKIKHGPTHKSIYKKYGSRFEEYYEWLDSLDSLSAIVAWDILTNKVNLETIWAAEASGNPITFNRVLWGANLDPIMQGDVENVLRSIAHDELLDDFEDWKKGVNNEN